MPAMYITAIENYNNFIILLSRLKNATGYYQKRYNNFRILYIKKLICMYKLYTIYNSIILIIIDFCLFN